MLVLLVEDDMDLAELIIEYLETESIECDIAYDGKMALNLLLANEYDVLITDVMMPRMDGLTLTDQVRKSALNLPILMLTAQDTLEDKLKGFEKGADDYLVKPFELAELSARIKVLGKRNLSRTLHYAVGDLILNTDTKQAFKDGTLLKLSASEFKLLELLMLKSPALVSRHQIEQHIWQDQLPSTDAYKMLVYRLRKALTPAEEANSLLVTVRGQGVAIRSEADSNE